MTRKKIADSLDNGPLAFLVQGLILVYLVSLSLETVPSLNAYAGTFKTIDTIITAVFRGRVGPAAHSDREASKVSHQLLWGG
jgi:hypothetical protein